MKKYFKLSGDYSCRNKSRIDFICLLMVFVLFSFVSIHSDIDLVENIYFLTREYEEWEIDEIIFVLVWASMFTTFYSYRRFCDVALMSKKSEWEVNNDILTGVKSRKYILGFIDYLESKHKKLGIAVSFVSLNDFKMINSYYGHTYGDELLKSVASRLLSIMDSNSVVARLGGDEFLIVYYNLIDRSDWERNVKLISAYLNEPYLIRNKKISIAHSHGVASFPECGNTIHEIISSANYAMFQSKINKDKSPIIVDRDLYNEMLNKKEIEEKIIKSFINNELYIVFQPIIEMENMQVIGFEALVRCCIDSCMISPELVVETLENNGLSEDFLRWLIIESSQESKEFLDCNQYISINITANQILSSRFIPLMDEVSESLSCKNIRLEITEHTAISDYDKLSEIILYLDKANIALMIDDFGTGYSSMDRLNQLDVKAVKIDRTFLDISSVKSKIILQAIFDVATELKMEVILEGVETKDQYFYLSNFPGLKVQGYYFQAPATKNDILKFLSDYK